jgi:2-dehydro-3-deoxygluconokinase
MAERLGLKVGLAAPAANDSAGSLLESVVRQRHPDLRLFLLKDSKQMTCIIVNLVDCRGARRAYFRKNEGGRKLRNLEAIASDFRAVHMSGYVMEMFGIRELGSLARHLRASGILVSLDLFPRIKLVRETGTSLDPLLGSVDLLFGNLQEFKDLTGLSRTSDILPAVTRDGMKVVIKRGSRGAILAAPGRTIPSHSLKVTPVSLKGAGDSFIAGFLAAHLGGLDERQALTVANLVASLHISGSDDRITAELIGRH